VPALEDAGAAGGLEQDLAKVRVGDLDERLEGP
jgi:hypothetical protein